MIRIAVTNENQRADLKHEAGPIELGRGPQRELARLVIKDAYVSRDQLLIEPLSGSEIRLTNLGGPVTVAEQLQPAPFDIEQTATTDPQEMAGGQVLELRLPTRITAGYTVIDVLPDNEGGLAGSMQTLSRPVRADEVFGRGPSYSLSSLGDAPSPETLTEWFEKLLQVQRAVAGSDEFYQQTAQAVVELIGLDRGLVLLRREDAWEVAARHAEHESRGPEFSRKVLAHICEERRTFFQGLKQDDRMQSLAGVEAVVASPIFDEHNQVAGALYGSRDLDSQAGRSGIRPLEAQVVQLLAAAVSTGLARLAREAEAARARVQFEQFFSHELARALERNPQMLDGQQRDVTALFCDVRRFSQISERLGAAETYTLLHDVMDALTDEIMARQGVVIDYHGDGLAAMWNAPIDDEQHAEKACQAALAVQQALPGLNSKWEQVLGFPLRIGVGVNTGSAQVGNAGSSRRLKYGPLGHTVNLASRVEGAAKQFGCDVLITDDTRGQLSEQFAVRPLCRVRVVGIQGDVAIHELRGAPGDEEWRTLSRRYANALRHFESGDLEAAHEAFQTLVVDFPDDKAAHFLLDSIIDAQQDPDAFEPVVQLSSK